jgi:hypothetical protein
MQILCLEHPFTRRGLSVPQLARALFGAFRQGRTSGQESKSRRHSRRV